MLNWDYNNAEVIGKFWGLYGFNFYLKKYYKILISILRANKNKRHQDQIQNETQ